MPLRTIELERSHAAELCRPVLRHLAPEDTWRDPRRTWPTSNRNVSTVHLQPLLNCGFPIGKRSVEAPRNTSTSRNLTPYPPIDGDCYESTDGSHSLVLIAISAPRSHSHPARASSMIRMVWGNRMPVQIILAPEEVRRPLLQPPIPVQLRPKAPRRARELEQVQREVAEAPASTGAGGGAGGSGGGAGGAGR